MNPYDIDGSDLPEPPHTPDPPIVPVPPADRETPQNDSVADLPEENPSPEKEVPAQRAVVAVAGRHNETAGRDIDGSWFKDADLRGAVIATTPDIVERLARSGIEKRSGRGIQDTEALQRLASMYVAPAGLLGRTPEGKPDTAYQILSERRVLLLTAPGDNCGQFSASLRLGQELRTENPELSVCEELMDPDLGLVPEGFLVENEPATLIIDLRGFGEQDLQVVHRTLVGFSAQLARYESYLILILPPGQERDFDDRYPNRMHLLEKPSSIDVFACQVGRNDSSVIIEDTETARQLESMWPPKVKFIAEIVRESIDQGEAPRQAFQEALQRECASQPSQLRIDIREKQLAGDTEWLALLIAAALLEGAPLMHIVDASDEFLSYSEVRPSEDLAPLLRPSPYTRLLRLAEEPQKRFDIDTRELQPHGFAKHVLRHFWLEHPDVREPLVEWLGEIPRVMAGLERQNLEQIADRVADLASESNAKIAIKLAAHWAKTKVGDDSGGLRTSTSPSARYRRSVAVRLLTTTATDATIGRHVRHQLWEWSRGSDADLQLLTAEVCAGFGTSFPRNALTRLKHLANSGNTDVRNSVVNAVQQIGIDLGTSRLLRYLAEWFDRASAARLSVLSESVRNVLGARSDDVEAGSAESFWRRALDAMPPDDLRPLVKSWVSTAAELDSDQRAGMVEPLVQATDHNSARIAQIWYASRLGPTSLDPSSYENDPVTEVIHQLWTRLDEVDPIWARE
ncbi:hypothetical protein OOZ19_04475 [Saccharopolyspora sp. NFXS83]|uniref:hypothetical protein n=1 Tax=Saccharopolyspora sp. NFXS83 TaxID=2993560 RepID=UPI00224B62AA|nr:hypothetical protein [Saccharopolyspora sp. NFXS83]MCX2729483.1 hypothetical protein [Saccharopolyspora sp. NFXS83]